MTDATTLSYEMQRLHDIMRDLRDKDTGCPWDIEQTFATIAPYTIEEAYEVSEAIYQGDRDKIAEELGDLLLQVVFHAQMAAEEGSFTLADVARRISDKMVRRHPHVFGDEEREDAAAQKQAWEEIKAAERAEKGTDTSLLADVAVTLPAMVRAAKLQKRAASVGFDWPDLRAVIAKLHEETGELLSEWDAPSREQDKLQDEMGDVLFVASNLARKVGVDPETALLSCNRKFEARFRHIEASLQAQGRNIAEASLDEMEQLWQEAKSL